MKGRTALLIAPILAASLLAASVREHATAAAPRRALPDLRCSILAHRNQNGTEPIVGSEVSYSGGSPSVWIRVRVQSSGVSDDPLWDQGNTSTGDGVWHTYGPFRVNLPSVTNKIEANALADVGGFVKESNETNNTCRLELTATVAH